MTRYRKRPVVIDAWQFKPEGWREVPSWLVEAIDDRRVSGATAGPLSIQTLEGEMKAQVGDWIIRGVADEIYPCKPEIFAATYEPAPDTGEGA